METDDRYGCPNCLGEGLNDEGTSMKHYNCNEVLRVLAVAPNGALPRSKVNPSVVAKLVRDKHATAVGASVMITRAGREQAETRGVK
jgi:hypothetical protein